MHLELTIGEGVVWWAGCGQRPLVQGLQWETGRKQVWKGVAGRKQ